MSRTAFWIDSDYDRDSASDDGSRYGSYVRERLGWFTGAGCWDWDDGAPRFAAVAWRIATGPVMVPGYVGMHPKILGADVERSDWDGSLLACVDLVTPWPGALECSRDWRDGKWWRDWPAEPRGGGEAYHWPSGQDLAGNPYLLASASLRFAVPAGQLPRPPARPAFTEPDPPPPARADLQALAATAQRSVHVLAAELGRVITPVLTALGRS
jgi:hypothetical protein